MSEKIAIDVMGSDKGPSVIVEGAVQASRELDTLLILVGKKEIIEKELSKHGSKLSRIEIVNAPEHISMRDGILKILKRTGTSIRKAVELVKEGVAGGVVSAGNTAAVMALSKTILGSIEGIERPALAVVIPTQQGSTLLLDVGANADCKPINLLQFAIMGSVFMKRLTSVENPRVALMSIGEEEEKGNELIKDSTPLFKNSNLNFIGNVEGKDLYKGLADVIVCDGFTGNVALKVSEGTAEILLSLLRREIGRSLWAKIGYLFMKRALKKFRKNVDYSSYGGALLLGVNGIAVVGHGRSDSHAIKNAIRVARDFIKNKIPEKIKTELMNFSPIMRKGYEKI